MEMRFDTRQGRESDLSKGRWQAHDAPTACQIFQQSRSLLGSRPIGERRKLSTRDSRCFVINSTALLRVEERPIFALYQNGNLSSSSRISFFFSVTR